MRRITKIYERTFLSRLVFLLCKPFPPPLHPPPNQKNIYFFRWIVSTGFTYRKQTSNLNTIYGSPSRKYFPQLTAGKIIRCTLSLTWSSRWGGERRRIRWSRRVECNVNYGWSLVNWKIIPRIFCSLSRTRPRPY